MRISDWSSDVCSSDLRTGEKSRVHFDSPLLAKGRGLLVQHAEGEGGAVADLVDRRPCRGRRAVTRQRHPRAGVLQLEHRMALRVGQERPDMGLAVRRPHCFGDLDFLAGQWLARVLPAELYSLPHTPVT